MNGKPWIQSGLSSDFWNSTQYISFFQERYIAVPTTSMIRRNQKHNWEVMSKNCNIKEALQKHQDQGPVLIVDDWDIKTLNYGAPGAFNDFLYESGTPPHHQVNLVGAAPGSGANDFGLSSLENLVVQTRVLIGGVVSNHLLVSFSLVSSNQQPSDTNRQQWCSKGDGVIFSELSKQEIVRKE